ncbi:DUF4493 domain-containing protein [uncultured Parabacteroides sp.]|uniref:DUF4493 domain-containing protein n=1 Tax=uncultured Parabacteroides sp. TaxID=512312 RepID=UPI0025F5B0D3|nr:DUF4493 domain-containing protein [uncultured Parabacteroides sp.]
MKKTILYTLFLPLLAAFTACSEGADLDNSPYTDGMGGLSLKNSTSTNITIPVITKSADFSDIEVDNFYVGILKADGSVAKEFDTFTGLVDAGLPLVLPHGDYSVIASSYKLGDIKVSATPYFVDQRNFTIEEKTTTNVDLKCTFKSLGVELALSEQFKKMLELKPNNYSYKVTVSNGVADWEFTPDKMDSGYFIDPCDELLIKVTVRLGSGDQWYPERTYRVKNNTNSPKLGEYYIINLDAGEQPQKLSLKAVSLTDKIEE